MVQHFQCQDCAGLSVCVGMITAFQDQEEAQDLLDQSLWDSESFALASICIHQTKKIKSE